jgi:hypothetical protein
MTKRKPAPHIPSKRIDADTDAENTNDAEVERLTNEITILRAQLAAKSIHEQWCPHYKKATTGPFIAGQHMGPKSGSPQLHPYSDPPKVWVPMIIIDPSLPKPEEKKHKQKQESVKILAGTFTPRAGRPKEKEWTQDNFCAAIQHWDFDCFKKHKDTPEAIDEAETAIYDLNSSSYDGWEEGSREQYVAELVFGGILRTMMEYGYIRLNTPSQFRSPPGTPGTITIYRTRRSQELPAWFLSHGFKIENDPDLIEGSEEELQELRKHCYERGMWRLRKMVEKNEQTKMTFAVMVED